MCSSLTLTCILYIVIQRLSSASLCKALQVNVARQRVCLIELWAWLDQLNPYADSRCRVKQTDSRSFYSQSYHSRTWGCGFHRPVMQQETGEDAQSGVKVICTQLQVEPSRCYDNRASHSCATWCAPSSQMFLISVELLFLWLSLWGKSITSQPATTQIGIYSCGDDKTISLLFHFWKYTTTLLSCHSKLTHDCGELHTSRCTHLRQSLEQAHG